MAVDPLEAKAHELIGHLGPNKLAAIVQLLEAMIEEDPGVETEPVTDEDRRRFQEGQAWFAQRDGKGLPMEDVLADFGLKTQDFPLTK